MNHDKLVRAAGRWLKTSCVVPNPVGDYARRVSCPVVLTEMVAANRNREKPDAIGFFLGHHSVLVECKTSRSDFVADKKKPFRQNPAFGMGDYRYFLMPPHVAKVCELPEKWGLLHIDETGLITLAKIAEPQSHNQKSDEMTLLVSAIRRLQAGKELKPVFTAPKACER